MSRTPERARYFRCTAVVGALWHPSLMSTGPEGAAAAGRTGRAIATAAAPVVVEKNLRRFIWEISYSSEISYFSGTDILVCVVFFWNPSALDTQVRLPHTRSRGLLGCQVKVPAGSPFPRARST